MIYLKLFLTFLKIGAFTFGGGYAMLPLMQQEVLLNNWMSETELLNFIAVAESTPGPVAINMATYIGIETAGFFGAVVATLGVVLPSFAIILLVAKFYTKYKESFVVKNCLKGLRPVVVGLIASAIISLGADVFLPNGFSLDALSFIFFASVLIFALVVYLAFKKVNPIYLILISAVLGIASGYIEKFLVLQ
ncbi:MAG: chromate transporter [Ruminococcaceae bacterium]|nr:chromate transporter [Oscillospiraceae bacterium]